MAANWPGEMVVRMRDVLAHLYKDTNSYYNALRAFLKEVGEDELTISVVKELQKTANCLMLVRQRDRQKAWEFSLQHTS